MKGLIIGVVCLCLAMFAQTNAHQHDTNDSEIKALLMAYHDPKISDETKAVIRERLVELGHVFAHDRKKRQVIRDGSHWCCKIVDERESRVFPVTKLRAETKVRDQTTESCNAMGVCTLQTITVNVTIFKTFLDHENALIVPQGSEPCPENFLTCCNGFFYFGPIDNCFNFNDFKELLDIYIRFPVLAGVWQLDAPSVVASANGGPSS